MSNYPPFHTPNTRLLECPCTCIKRRSRRREIIHENNRGRRVIRRTPECPVHCGQTITAAAQSLRARPPDTPEERQHRKTSRLGKQTCQTLRLIEPALKSPHPVQRHRAEHRLLLFENGQSLEQKLRQLFIQRRNSAVLECADRFLQEWRIRIGARGNETIQTADAAPTQICRLFDDGMRHESAPFLFRDPRAFTARKGPAREEEIEEELPHAKKCTLSGAGFYRNGGQYRSRLELCLPMAPADVLDFSDEFRISIRTLCKGEACTERWIFLKYAKSTHLTAVDSNQERIEQGSSLNDHG